MFARVQCCVKGFVSPLAFLALLGGSGMCDWTSFRNGGVSQSSVPLPTKWSPESGIAWQRELIGYGQSTPIVFGERLYVCSVEGEMKDSCVLQCLSLQSGEEVWQYRMPAANRAASNYMASRAAPTPAVDENAVYAFYEGGNVVALDHAGKLLWKRDLTAEYGPFDNNHGLGASPTLYKNRLILNVEHRGPSYLIALDTSNGQTLWKTDRPSSSSWSSPIVAPCRGRTQVIVSSGGTASGYDVETGVLDWKVDGLEGNSVPSPTVLDSKLLIGARPAEFSADESSGANCCIDLERVGEQGKEVLWRASKVSCDYASPVVAGSYAYFLSKAGVLHCLRVDTGEVLYSKRLGIQCWGTPIVSGDSVYFFGKDGRSIVIRVQDEFEIVATNDLWDLSNPPKPESYVEAVRSEARGGESGGEGGRPNGRRGGGAGGGMMAMIQTADKNSDGILSAEEIPQDLKPMLARVDLNSDGSLDAAEIKAMSESFAARRADSQASARDPIVYGAVAAGDRIVIRTGTRIYCIQR